MGVPGAASATITVSASAIGGLFAGGVASCTMTISASGSIAGLAAGSAAATISVSASANTGAIAWGVATGVFSVTATAQAYGLGYMVASTVDNSVMTPLSITQAVLGALAADYNLAGTIGAKINSAASGGVDYAGMADAVRTELQAELLRIVELAKVHGLVAGTDLIVTPTSRTAGDISQTITGDGITSTTVHRT